MQDDRIVPGSVSNEAPLQRPEDGPLKQHHRKIVAGVVAACSVALIGVSAFFLIPAMGQVSAEDMLQTTSDQASKVASNKEAASSEGKATTDKETAVDAGAGNEASTLALGERAEASGDGSGGSGSVSSGSDGSSQSPDSSTSSSESDQASENNAVTVSVSVSSSAVGNPVSGGTTATFAKGATVYDALMACGLSIGEYPLAPPGSYVCSIGGLAEREYGKSSGWKYAVNGSIPGISCGGYVLSDGDVILWYYALGAND